MGLIGAMVEWATAPESALLVLRFVVAGMVLGRGVRAPPAAGRAARPRRLAAPPLDGRDRRDVALLLFFVAMRRPGSRSGCSCSSSPRSGWRSWRHASCNVADRPHRLPGARPGARRPRRHPGALVRRRGGTAAVVGGGGAGWPQAPATPSFQLSIKDLTTAASPASAIVIAEAWIDAASSLPLALWQTVGAGYELTTRDLFAGLVLGVGLHGPGVHDVDRGGRAHPRAALLDTRLPRAGHGADLRASTARAEHLGMDDRRRSR